jgi:4-hydroxy-3-polyprenylbenzoate decarboxylase
MRTLIGVTGGSGAVFALDFIRRCPGEKYLAFSRWGKYVLRQETDLVPADLAGEVDQILTDHDLSQRFSSGTNALDAMVIIPCSSTTLGKIAAGIGDTFITRAAAVTLKERRKLILVLRETPLSTIHLEAAAKVSAAGALVMPLCPPFYFRPDSVADVVTGFVDHLLAQVGVKAEREWNMDAPVDIDESKDL